jgi:SAM-dependent methyltransferase
VTPDERQARLAKLYDAEILPAYAARFVDLLLRAVEVRPAARLVEIGCATGALTRELAARFDAASQLTAFDESPSFIAEARAKIERETRSHAQVSWVERGGSPATLLRDVPPADLIVSNLTLAAAADPRAAVREAARLLAPGGRLVLSTPLRGSWGEFLDLFRDVLRENGKEESLRALDRYLDALPDAERAAGWLEEAGLGSTTITVARWEILFKSAREFFFAPLVELGPLSRWKRLSGGGDEMQDIFFFTKEAIDTYFKDRVFAVSIVGAVVGGQK